VPPRDPLTQADAWTLTQATALLRELAALARWTDSGGLAHMPRPAQASSNVQVLAQQVFDSFLPPTVCEYVLRKFLQATATSVLQEYKRRIERCRRALLGEMLQVTHRQQPLLQVEVPDKRPDRIEGVNEAQLRGYVMLVSAKLPLLENVKLYLEEIGAEHH